MKRNSLVSIILIIIIALAILIGCGQTGGVPAPEEGKAGEATPVFTAETSEPAETKPFELTSPVLKEENIIPTRYSCHGEELSLPLEWGDPPARTKSLALLMDDPDVVWVGGFAWVHWLVFNMPPEMRELTEGIPISSSLTDESLQGLNSWNQVGYRGPCPPSGLHHYVFKLYALDSMLDADSSLTSDAFESLIEGHVLAQSELETVFQKR